LIISTPQIQTPDGLATDGVLAVDPADLPEAERETRALRVPAELAGQRADRILAELLPEFSRAYLQQRIEAGAVRCGLAPPLAPLRKAAQRLKPGEQLEVDLEPTAQSQAYRPEAMAIETVYVDEHLRVVNKPAGLVVHPAPGNWQGTLLNGLLALDAQAMQLPRAGIVHRLDKDTSGLMVVARTRAAKDALVRAIAAREVRREYQALAHRRWGSTGERAVHAAIGRDARNRLRMAVVDLARQAGKPANTTFTLLRDWDEACLVQAKLGTGRTHQIRVHMAHLGHPLVGDVLYGGQPRWGMDRQALHAWRLAFDHPVTGESMAWESALPADFQAALAALGLS
jgi:23S rRNA pseudouridine1911/1915/1917 synthase